MIGLRLTITGLCSGEFGGCGRVKRGGALTIVGNWLNPIHGPPGCQAHPYPGTNNHEPLWNGVHPQGYDDTHT